MPASSNTVLSHCAIVEEETGLKGLMQAMRSLIELSWLSLRRDSVFLI